MQSRIDNLTELVDFREHTRIFSDRQHAGRVLGHLLAGRVPQESLVLAIPAGGVPVACALAGTMGLEKDVMVVSKITFPWNSEAGYGAVAQNGLVRLDQRILNFAGLSEAQVQQGISVTTAKVNRRAKTLRGDKPPLDLQNRKVVLVDDGIASGTTMRVAIEAARQLGAASVVLAVPTAHQESLRRISSLADAIYCANVRSGSPFAVADAYHHWFDVSESSCMALLAGE